MSTRTDIHRPSAEQFDPEQYEVVATVDLHPRHGSEGRTQKIEKQIAAGHRFASHQKPRNCGHCGARIRYAALLLHHSGEMIYVGETCLDGRFCGTKAQFEALRKQAKVAREREGRAERFEKNLVNAVERDWRLESLGNREAVINLPESVSDFALSVRSSLAKGPLSDRQVETLAQALDRAYGQVDAERERAEQWAKEKAESIPVPEGAHVVTGVIRSTKTKPNYYSYGGSDIPKMVVRDERGFTVWGTVPAGLFTLAETDLRGMRGMTISFRATLERSDDDAGFGFFKRPTQMVLVSSEVDLDAIEDED